MVPGEAGSHHENAHSADEGGDVAHVGEAVPWRERRRKKKHDSIRKPKLTNKIRHFENSTTRRLWSHFCSNGKVKMTNMQIFNFKGLILTILIFTFYCKTAVKQHWVKTWQDYRTPQNKPLFTSVYKNTEFCISAALLELLQVCEETKKNGLRRRSQQLTVDVTKIGKVSVPFMTS